jgi:hypothetical protein
MSQKIEFHKVRGIAEIINTTFEFIKQNFKGLFKSVALISGPFILACAILYGYLMYAMVNVTTQYGGQRLSNPFASLGSELLLVGLGVLIAFFLFYAVVYEYINIYVNQDLGTIQISDVLKAIRKDFWLMIRTMLGLILIFFITMLIFGLGAIVAVAVGGAISLLTGPVVIFIFIIASYGFLFYLLIPYALIFNIRIYERRRFFNAVSQCHTLIAGNRLKTMGVIFLSLLLQVMISFVLSIPNYIIQYINVQSSYQLDFKWLGILTGSLVLIAGFVIGTISIIAINLQYFNLLERKQSTSLLYKIEGIGSTPKTAIPGNEETY